MPDITDITKIEGLSDVSNNLIDKISTAIGWGTISVPHRLATEHLIDEVKKSNLDPLTQAAIISNAGRLIKEYANQVNIVSRAIPMLTDDSRVDDIEDDWIASFMDKTRLISDEDFQLIWAKLLAEEASVPGTISLRTLETLKSLSKSEALLFQKYAKRAVMDGKQAFILTKFNGLLEDYSEILKLEDCGLISSQQIELKLTIPHGQENLVLHDKKTCCFMETKSGTCNFKLSAYVFTKAGYEFLHAIDMEDADYVLLDYFKDTSARSQQDDSLIVHIYKTVAVKGETISYTKDDLLNGSSLEEADK